MKRAQSGSDKTRAMEMGARCDECPLKDQPIVYSAGPDKADIVIVGEAPGREEVQRQEPFVGPSGKLLNMVLKHHNIDREKVFVTNACLCRPKVVKGKQTPPNAKAMKCCLDRLLQEVKDREPERVIAAGGVAAKALLGTKDGIKTVRVGGPKTSPYGDYEVVPTFHPALALRSPDVFPSIVSDIKKVVNVHVGWEPPRYKVVDDVDRACSLLRKQIEAAPRLACDVEVAHKRDGHSLFTPDWLCIGISHRPGAAVVYDEQVCKSARFQHALRRAMALADKEWVYQNGKFDTKMLWSFAPEARVGSDSMLAHYSLCETKGTHDLEQLSAEYLGAPSYKQEARQYLPTQDAGLHLLPKEVLHRYNAIDVSNTHLLIDVLNDEMKKDGVYDAYRDILIPASYSLGVAEYHGILLDSDYLLHEIGDDVLIQRDEAKIKIFEQIKDLPWVTEKFCNSPQQITKAFSELYGIKLPSTDKENMEPLAKKGNPLAKAIVAFRKVDKLYSTYVVGPIKNLDADGRLRVEYKLHGTECVTGDSLIWTDKGLRRADDICNHSPGFEKRRLCILGINGPESTSHTYVGSERATRKLSLGYGLSLSCTAEHPLLTLEGWKLARRLTTTDYVLTAYGKNFFPKTSSIQPELAELIGMFLSDGHVRYAQSSSHYFVAISNQDDAVRSRVDALSWALYDRPAKWDASNGSIKITGRDVASIWKVMFPVNGAAEKQVPREILGGNRDAMISFVRGVSLDSSWCKASTGKGKPKKYLIRFRSIDRERLVITQQVLWNLGVRASLAKEKYPTKTGRRHTGDALVEFQYHLDITGHEILKYLEIIGVVTNKQQAKAKQFRNEIPKARSWGAKNFKCVDGEVYVKVLVNERNKNKQRVYDLTVPRTHSFVVNGVVSHNTGRLSASPNIQNWPMPEPDNPDAYNVRAAVIAPEGYNYCSFDYVGIEMVVMAYLSGDDNMIEAFRSGEGTHKPLARSVFGKDYSARQYRDSKSIAFGSLYLETHAHLAHRLGIKNRQALAIQSGFYKLYPKVRAVQKEFQRQVLEDGEIQSIFGRKRRFWLITDKNKKHVIKEGCNFPIQSAAHDFTLTSLNRLTERFDIRPDRKGKVHFTIEVHDDLTAEIADDYIDEAAHTIREVMEDTKIADVVPTRVEAKVGKRWGLQKEYKFNE